MARTFAKVNLDLWNDPAFLALPPAAQHLYLVLWTSPDLSHCGVHDWRPGRLAARSQGFTAEHIKTVSDCLAARHFLVIDHGTEEVLIRSRTRFDETMKQWRLAVSYVDAYQSTYSPTLRGVLTNELHKIREELPGEKCWADERVSTILAHPRISAKDLPVPNDPFAQGLAQGLGMGLGMGLGLGLAQTRDGVSPRVSPPPTTTTTTTTTTNNLETRAETSATKPRTKRKRQLPDDFTPTPKHQELADELGVDLNAEISKFKDHHTARGSVMSDWNAALRTWLNNSVRFGGVRAAPGNPTSAPVSPADFDEPAPIDPTPEEYRDWYARQIAKRKAAGQ